MTSVIIAVVALGVALFIFFIFDVAMFLGLYKALKSQEERIARLEEVNDRKAS